MTWASGFFLIVNTRSRLKRWESKFSAVLPDFKLNDVRGERNKQVTMKEPMTINGQDTMFRLQVVLLQPPENLRVDGHQRVLEGPADMTQGVVFCIVLPEDPSAGREQGCSSCRENVAQLLQDKLKRRRKHTEFCVDLVEEIENAHARLKLLA